MNGSTSLGNVNDFIYRTVKAYDLLQIGIAARDLGKVEQATNLYAELWSSSADKIKWQNLFTQLFINATSCINQDAVNFGAPGASAGGNDAIKNFRDKNNPGQFDPYFSTAIQLQLATLVYKSCYQMQTLSPNATLNNGLKPSDFAVQVYKTFITNY